MNRHTCTYDDDDDDYYYYCYGLYSSQISQSCGSLQFFLWDEIGFPLVMAPLAATISTYLITPTLRSAFRCLGPGSRLSNVPPFCCTLCKLCTLEKFYIICKRELATLNKRTELASICRHVNTGRFLLKNT